MIASRPNILKLISVLVLVLVIVTAYLWFSKPTISCRSESIGKEIACSRLKSIPNIVKDAILEIVLVDSIQDGVLTTVDDFDITVGLEVVESKYRIRLQIPDELINHEGLSSLVSLGVVNKIDFTINRTDDIQVAMQRNKDNVKKWSNLEYIRIYKK